MVRSSALTLKFATSKKLDTLDLVLDEYARVNQKNYLNSPISRWIYESDGLGTINIMVIHV